MAKLRNVAGMFYQQTGKQGMSADEFASNCTTPPGESLTRKAYILVGLDALDIELMVKLLPVSAYAIGW